MNIKREQLDEQRIKLCYQFDSSMDVVFDMYFYLGFTKGHIPKKENINWELVKSNFRSHRAKVHSVKSEHHEISTSAVAGSYKVYNHFIFRDDQTHVTSTFHFISNVGFSSFKSIEDNAQNFAQLINEYLVSLK